MLDNLHTATMTSAKLRELAKDLSNLADQYDENDRSQRFALRIKANQVSALATTGMDVAFSHLTNVGIIMDH